MWFVNKTFGATFRLVQGAVVTKPDRLTNYAFQDEESTSAAAAAGEDEDTA